MKRKQSVLFLLFILTLTACSGPSKPKLIWQVQLPASTAGLYGMHKNILFINAGEYLEFGSPNHQLFALNPDNGDVIWKKNAGKGTMMGKVYFQENHLFWHNAEGKVAMVLKVHSGIKMEPAPLLSAQKKSDAEKESLERVILKKEGMKTLTLFSMGMQKKHWQYRAKNPIASYRKTGPLILLATRNDWVITALSLKSGKEIWRVGVPRVNNVKKPGVVNFCFLLYYDKLFVINYDARVYAYQVPLNQ